MIVSKVFKRTARGELLFSGWNLDRVPPNGRQHFFVKQTNQFKDDGAVTIDGDTLTFHSVGDAPSVDFTIDHPPGTYCCHDGVQIAVPKAEADLPQGHRGRGQAARDYVAKHHKGKASPDARNPSGYKVKNYYGCTVQEST